MTDDVVMVTSLRWAGRIGWLLVIGSLALVAMAGTGSMSEGEMVANSLYIALAFGFGAGMIIGSRRFIDAPKAWSGALTLGACGAAVVALIRWYILVKFFR